MAIVGWVDSVALAAEWWDAPDQPELIKLLDVAHENCLAYAPALAGGATVPKAWAQAQVLWTKHLYARGKSGNQETVGPDGYTVSTFPLVLEARSLLRPKTSPYAGLG